MKIAIFLFINLGITWEMNVPETTPLPKQPREESTFLPKIPRDNAINLEDIVEVKKPSDKEMDLLHTRASAMSCGQTVDLVTAGMALLQTNNFGSYPWYYPRNQRCKWTLEAPAGSTVELYFSMFDVRYGDWFIVDYNDYYYGSIWQPFAVPMELGPNENSISFMFYSNSDRRRGRGFRFKTI